MFRPSFVDHLVFRVAELGRSERFYSSLLGEPSYRSDDNIMYFAGDTRLFFTLSDELTTEKYAKEQTGLNHMAFGVRSIDELQAIQLQLDEAHIIHSGIKVDQYGLKEFIWLDDPDGMRVEFYLRP